MHELRGTQEEITALKVGQAAHAKHPITQTNGRASEPLLALPLIDKLNPN
jgi:hypothetical protein